MRSDAIFPVALRHLLFPVTVYEVADFAMKAAELSPHTDAPTGSCRGLHGKLARMLSSRGSAGMEYSAKPIDPPPQKGFQIGNMSAAGTIMRKTWRSLRGVLALQRQLDDLAFLAGQAAARQVRILENLHDLCDTEFRVSSQWGEDGIIEWLVHQLDNIPETFIEFGVENYRESNTRFLLQHRNWRGLVIDGSEEHIDFIRRDRISWRHDLTAIASFITRDNINSIIRAAGFSGEIGVLSVDIDGVDYWVWEAINCIAPQIIVVEYNSAFGDLHPLTVPYTPDFIRSRAHHSNLYYGLSIRAAKQLAARRGYTLVGTNRMGSNAFFVRNDRADKILRRIEAPQDRPSRFRESRATDGRLTFTAPGKRTALVANLPVIDVSTNSQMRLGEAGELFSPRWQALLAGQLTTS